MMIKKIINNALKRLKAEGKLLTPDFYAEAFCKEAKKANMKVEDCEHLENSIQLLNKDLQADLRNYHIKTIKEFVRYVVTKLNRTNPTQCTKILESQILLTKRILQVAAVLHNKEIASLSRSTIEIMESTSQPQQLDSLRQQWVNFITTYDDTFLQELKPYGAVDSSDLRKTITGLDINISQDSKSKDELTKLARLLVASFVPSIASSVNDEIASVSDKLRNNPAILESDTIENEIRSIISLRIALDNKTVKDMVGSIDGVLDKLSLRLIAMIESSDTSNLEIQEIKKELESYSEESTTNFKVAHKKLFTIAVALEKNTQLLSSELKGHSMEVKLLSDRVNSLEKELENAKKESQEDFLTKLVNKRALDKMIKVKDAEYKRYGRNYSVAMFDIDHFKKVNDNYGHEAGDAILAAVAKILKNDSRTVDIVGRFGGEEFLAILSDTDLQGGVTFAQKAREHVQKARFVYKGKRIKVTISAGVSERKNHVSAEATINSADEYLYKAKHEGRNRVEYKK
ncbi:GGDEF domain-containing protein [Sulfurimonas sp.]|uniref:GGDEF domain-containing protein n=1 Tax=Sulfurimonas sp. TaxID=2022749 RepID=UPI0026293BF1|nr:GGDEF domain-containing protein [Sulfurimonas sp.]